MDSSASLINISVSTPNPEGFKGIDESGEITAVFDSNAELTKPTVFGRTVNAKLTGVFNKSAHQKSEEKYTYQKSLAERRAEILTGKNTDPGEIEDKLLGLVDQCSQKQETEGNEFIKVKSLNKQVQRDIKIHLSNEIKKATSPNRLEVLHGKIKQLESKIDKDVMTKLQKELDHQCDRIAKKIEAHIETADLGSMLPEDAACTKCRCVMTWSKTIQTISPKSFAKNHKDLGHLLSKTYSSSLGSVTPHENDLGITKQRYSKIEELSKEVKDGITETLGEKSKNFKKMDTATTECLPPLKRNLELVPKLVTRYCRESKKLERLKLDKDEKEVKKSETQEAQTKNTSSRSELRDNKKESFWGKHKIFRLLDKDYQNKVGEFKKERKNLSKQMDEAKINLGSVQWQIGQAENTLEKLSGDIGSSAEQYGWSIQKLDQFNDLQQTKAAFPSQDELIAVIENKSQQTVVKKPTPKRKAPKPPSLSDRSISETTATNTLLPSTVTTSQKSTVVQEPEGSPFFGYTTEIPSSVTTSQESTVEQLNEDDYFSTIRNDLDFFPDNIINSNIYDEDITWIVDRTNYTLETDSVNLKSVSEFFNHFESTLNQEHNRNGNTAYHDRNSLLNGFQNGLVCLEDGKTLEQAKAALDNTLAAVHEPVYNTGQTIQSQDELPAPTFPPPPDADELPAGDANKIQVNSPIPTAQANNRQPPPLLFTAEDLQQQSRKLSNSEDQEQAVVETQTKSVLEAAQNSPLLSKVPIGTQVHSILSKFAQVEDATDDDDSGFGEMVLSFKDGERDRTIEELINTLSSEFKQLPPNEIKELATKLCSMRTLDGEEIDKTIEGY